MLRLQHCFAAWYHIIGNDYIETVSNCITSYPSMSYCLIFWYFHFTQGNIFHWGRSIIHRILVQTPFLCCMLLFACCTDVACSYFFPIMYGYVDLYNQNCMWSQYSTLFDYKLSYDDTTSCFMIVCHVMICYIRSYWNVPRVHKQHLCIRIFIFKHTQTFEADPAHPQ